MRTAIFTFGVAALLLLLAVAAGTARAQQSAYDPEFAMSMLYYSKAAVCPASALKTWSCGPSCDKHAEFRVEGVYLNTTGKNDQQLFTGWDAKTSSIIIAGRGTETLSGWMHDFDAKHVAFPDPRCQQALGAKCLVEAGFLAVWLEFEAHVMGDVRRMIARYGARNVRMIACTGHSLGAALSIIAATQLQRFFGANLSIPVVTYNFGEPRVFNPETAAWVQRVALPFAHPQYHVVNALDPFPHLPTESMHYLHVPTEVWYPKGGDRDFMVCNGSAIAGHEDPRCSDSVLPIDPFDHLNYLGISTGCGDSLPGEAVRRVEEFKRSEKFQRLVKAIKYDNEVRARRRRGGL